MITYDKAQLEQWAKEARESAAQLNYEWDELAINWPLTADSVVWEVGSFKGRWALQIAQLYDPKLYCFEPQQWAWQVTRLVLHGFNARTYNFGLADRDGVSVLWSAGTDGASLVHAPAQAGGGKETEDIELREITAVLYDLRVSEIDLMLVNIEGYEYTLLPYMMERGIKPHWLMVQCHGAKEDYGRLIETLRESYTPLWDYGMTLSAWERR